MQNTLDQHWSSHYKNKLDFRMISSQSLSDILELTDKSLEKTCLDIGCGTGQLTRELNHRGYRCLGIDVSHVAIQLAQSLTVRGDELHYEQFNIEADDISKLPKQPYSLITCKLVYAFIKDRAHFLDRVSELLMPGGMFIVITPVYHQVSEATPISVDFDTALHDLSSKFNTVTTLEESGLVTFACCNE